VRITQAHADQLRRRNYAIVPGFLTPDELAAARQNFLRYAPTAEELAATPERYSALLEDAENLQTEFPFAGDALNQITTHPEIIAFVERLLGTRDVLLSQSAIWAKYAGTGDFEQGLHLDYEGNTLVVPRDDGDFRQVNMILYYSDVGPEMGPTYIVPLEQTRDLPAWPPFRTRKKHPELYKHERPVLAQAGDLLIFGMRTYHRASAITAEAGARFSHHLVYRAAANAFAGYHQWSRFGERPELKHFLQTATPRQREVLGFPPPGHVYWNQETLAAVALRYPKMDMTPYRKTPNPEISPRSHEDTKKK
jgi:ectoine hydroxylase-related dioxygenase (phytanoyl-CoA dioxygenase family)